MPAIPDYVDGTFHGAESEVPAAAHGRGLLTGSPAPAMEENTDAGRQEQAGMSDPRDILIIEMSRRGTSPVLVGRATEMAALEAAFETVRQGGPAALLIGGEAGVGKTRLISEFTERARTSGARVLAGGCLELGADGLPFGPFTAMLRDLVRETGAEEITAMLPGSGRAIRELARLLPELANASALACHPGRRGGRLGTGGLRDRG